jgi:MFS family permease
MFPATAAVAGVAAVIALALPRADALAVRAERGDWKRLLAHPPYVRLLVVGLLGYLLLQGPMALFPVFVRAHGGSLDTVSRLWLLMLALEVPLIALSGASLRRIGARGLLATGLVAGGVRWVVCGFAPESAWVVPVQALHGVVVAGLVIGGPLYVEAVVPESLRSTGQNVLAMVGLSLGGLLSHLGAGILLDLAGPDAPYQVGGIGALLAATLLSWWLPKPTRAES